MADGKETKPGDEPAAGGPKYDWRSDQANKAPSTRIAAAKKFSWRAHRRAALADRKLRLAQRFIAAQIGRMSKHKIIPTPGPH